LRSVDAGRAFGAGRTHRPFGTGVPVQRERRVRRRQHRLSRRQRLVGDRVSTQPDGDLEESRRSVEGTGAEVQVDEESPVLHEHALGHQLGTDHRAALAGIEEPEDQVDGLVHIRAVEPELALVGERHGGGRGRGHEGRDDRGDDADGHGE
jgi:hypothetical protein